MHCEDEKKGMEEKGRGTLKETQNEEGEDKSGRNADEKMEEV